MSETTTAMLDDVRIATPCTARWEDMTGDERVRRCGLCKLDVYNVAEMSRDEAESLLRAGAARTCVRIFRREDGTVLTRDCPSALRAVRRRVTWAAAALLAAGAAAAAMFVPRGSRGVAPVLRATMGEASARPTEPKMGKAVMGDVCVPRPPADPPK